MCADNTPLQIPPLLDDFGYTCNTIAGGVVTESTYVPPPESNDHTKNFLNCMRCPAYVNDSTIDDTFTTDDYIER